MTNSELDRYVVDTHTLAWYLTDDVKLSEAARQVMRRGASGEHDLILPVIVLAELLRMVERGRTTLAFRDVVDWMTRSPRLVVLPFDLLLFSDLIGFGTELELHDRIIATTARMYRATVVTRDRAFEGLVPTLW